MNHLNNLDCLALKYRCDKIIRHSYIPLYKKVLSTVNVRALLEIGIGYKEIMRVFSGPGVQDGASIWMWNECFPEANIYACDIREDIQINEGRIKSFVVDQSNEDHLREMMHNICENLDVIIDDGSHVTEHQIFTARILLPFVRKGGVYIIEDAQCPHDVQKALGEGTVHVGTRACDDHIVMVRR